MTTARARATGQASLSVVNILALIGVVAIAFVLGHFLWRPKPEPPSSTTYLTEELTAVSELVSTKDHIYEIIKYDPHEKLFGLINVGRKHILAIARGYVNLGIDMRQASPIVNDATKTATVSVPHASIRDVVPESLLYVDVRTGAFFHFTPTDAQAVNAIAKEKLRFAAESLKVAQHADSNVVKALTDLFKKSGYALTVTFQ